MSKQTALVIGVVVAIVGMVSITAIFRHGELGESAAGEPKARAALGEDAAWRVKPSGQQHGAALSSAYVPNIPLKSQISGLARDADNGNTYSACILAAALDICHRQSESAVLFDYPDTYLAGMREEQAESFALSVSSYEHRVSQMCAGVEAIDAHQRAHRLLKAAIAGHAGSISRLFSLRELSVDGPEPPDKSVAAAFRGNAERMLNRAAEAGEVRAIELVSFAYLTGNISSPLGSVSIRADELKALGASQALALIRDESKKRKIPFYDFDDREIRANIESRIAQMRREELARFSGFVSLYYDAYWNNYDRKPDKIGPMSELPEESCETMKQPEADVARTAASARGTAARKGAHGVPG
jgi:hypothetical protein